MRLHFVLKFSHNPGISGPYYGYPTDFVSPLYNGRCDLQVFFAVLIGAFSIGQAAPNFDKLITAAGASVAIYNVIDRVSNRVIMYVDTPNIYTRGDRTALNFANY